MRKFVCLKRLKYFLGSRRQCLLIIAISILQWMLLVPFSLKRWADWQVMQCWWHLHEHLVVRSVILMAPFAGSKLVDHCDGAAMSVSYFLPQSVSSWNRGVSLGSQSIVPIAVPQTNSDLAWRRRRLLLFIPRHSIQLCAPVLLGDQLMLDQCARRQSVFQYTMHTLFGNVYIQSARAKSQPSAHGTKRIGPDGQMLQSSVQLFAVQYACGRRL